MKIRIFGVGTFEGDNVVLNSVSTDSGPLSLRAYGLAKRQGRVQFHGELTDLGNGKSALLLSWVSPTELPERVFVSGLVTNSRLGSLGEVDFGHPQVEVLAVLAGVVEKKVLLIDPLLGYKSESGLADQKLNETLAAKPDTEASSSSPLCQRVEVLSPPVSSPFPETRSDIPALESSNQKKEPASKKARGGGTTNRQGPANAPESPNETAGDGPKDLNSDVRLLNGDNPQGNGEMVF